MFLVPAAQLFKAKSVSQRGSCSPAPEMACHVFMAHLNFCSWSFFLGVMGLWEGRLVDHLTRGGHDKLAASSSCKSNPYDICDCPVVSGKREGLLVGSRLLLFRLKENSFSQGDHQGAAVPCHRDSISPTLAGL